MDDDERAMRDELRALTRPFQVPPGTRVRLSRDHDPSSTGPFRHKSEGAGLLRGATELLADFQRRLAAQESFGLLLCLQGIDAAGKDSTIRHVMSGVNPQGVTVSSFKVPSEDERRHDYLWRYAVRLPRRGEIGIFNRSHYEEVLVVRIHPEHLEGQHLPRSARGDHVWQRRFRQINDWERYLCENGIRIVKVFLHLSKEEQRRRFLKRLDRPDKNWKFSSDDVHERVYWDAYETAFSDMLSHTSTGWAPWHVVPADHKWFTRICVAAILVEALRDIDPQYPVVTGVARQALADAKRALAAEASAGADQRRSSRPRT